MSVIVGYYQAWKCYKNFTIDNIDPLICTHLIYAFAGIKNNRIHVNDKWGDIDQKGYLRFNALKRRNPRLKTLLAVGGWEEGSKSFSEMARSSSSRKEFIQSCIEFLNKYDFDGIDLDWEYPCLRDGCAADKRNFTHLVKEMSSAFGQRFLLTAAVAAGKDTMNTSYEVREISRYLDFIHLMTYDMHNSGVGSTSHHAPLYANNENNVSNSVRAWIEAGANSSKLVLGVAAYGRAFTLSNPNRTSIGAPTSGPGNPESVDYNEIVERENSGWTKQWDDNQQVPYIYMGNQWIGYDNPRSVNKKVHFARQNGLGGVMLWSIDSDASRGCPSLLAAMNL